MTKLLYGVMSAAILGLCTISVTVATNWVQGVNADRREPHDAIKELQFRSVYLNGNIPAAPVTVMPKK